MGMVLSIMSLMLSFITTLLTVTRLWIVYLPFGFAQLIGLNNNVCAVILSISISLWILSWVKSIINLFK